MQLAQANTVSPRNTELIPVNNWTSYTKLIKIAQTMVKIATATKKA